MEIIDSHHHLWDLHLFQYDWMPEDNPILRQSYLPDELAPILENCSVSGSVVVQADQTVEEAKFLLKCANDFPWMKGVVGWVDLQDERVGDTLDELIGLGPLVGIRHQVEEETDQEWLLRKQTLAGLKAVSDRNLSYDLLLKPVHLKQIPSLCDELPDLRMVVDHIAKPNILEQELQPWSDLIHKLEPYKNLFCKVSGMITEADHNNWKPQDLRPYVQIVREVFGIDRLMWGSDWPVCLLAGDYREVMEAALFALGEISSEEATRFMSGSAEEFYRLR
jgi:L-fuconolactonase